MMTHSDSLPENKPRKVLVVSDNSSLLDSLELTLLDNYSFSVTTFGDEVFTKLKAFLPDIILLEFDSIDGEGYKICSQIKSDPRLQHISVIFILFEKELNDRVLAYEAGADECIFYPFHNIELKAKLKLFTQLQEEREKRYLLERGTKQPSVLISELKSCKQQLENSYLRLKYEMECCSDLKARLFNSEEKFRNMVNQTRDGILVSQGERLKYINPKMVHLTGYSYKELVDNPLTMAIHPEDRKKVIERHHRRLDGENVISRYQFRLITAQNKIKWVELRVASTIWWEGKRATLGFLSDLTERLKKQEAAVQTEKMISVSGMAAGIAHEINNPLAGIMQSVQNIIRRLDPMLQANLKAAQKNTLNLEQMHSYLLERNIINMLQGIWQYGERASRVIQNMLHFVKKNETDMKPTNLNQLIDNTIDLLINNEELQQQYQTNFIEIHRFLDESLPEVPCLKSEIQKVLINVLINAVQSVSENRLARLPKIVVRSRSDNNMIRIEIEDNGSGINIMTQRRIFEPFYSTRPVGEGQGIGLSISYMVITHNHDGKMEVESSSDWGTRIIIRLPFKRPIFKQKEKNLINVLSDLH